MRKLRPLAFALLVAGLPLAAAAHHGWGGYDSTRLVTLSGTIEQSGYTNPHGELRLRSADKSWRITLAPPYRMENRGLPAGMIAVGKTATVEGYVSKSDPDELRAERITVDGKTTELR